MKEFLNLNIPQYHMAAKNTIKKVSSRHVRPDNHILHICHGDTGRAQVLCDVVQGRGEGSEVYNFLVEINVRFGPYWFYVKRIVGA